MSTRKRFGVTFAAVSLTVFLYVATASATLPPGLGGASTAPSHPTHLRAAMTSHALSCRTVPTSLFSASLGTSMVFTGMSAPHDRLNIEGKVVLIAGKPLSVVWLSCSYAHNPANLTQMNLSVSYLVEPTAARTRTILKSMCNALRPGAANYQMLAIGEGACSKGTLGPMQNSTGFAASNRVFVSMFGAQSPSQTIALQKGIVRQVAAMTSSTATSPGPSTQATPVVAVSTTDFSIGTTFMTISLNCSKASCRGDAQLLGSGPLGTVVLASTPYILPKASHRNVLLSLSTDGLHFFATALTNPVQATLHITVVGGKTVSRSILVTYATTSTTEATTSTIASTTLPS
jgi:hypothetical protein